MILAATTMIKPSKQVFDNNQNQKKLNYFAIFIIASFIGIIAGLVGAGGGFLIIPALVVIAKTPVKKAIGTSLCIIALQSLVGFWGDDAVFIDWQFLLTFTTFAIIGIFIGDYLSKKIDGYKLKIAFGWFVLTMGIYIIFKELI